MGTNNEKLEAGSKPSGSVSLVIGVSRQRLTEISERPDRGMSPPPVGGSDRRGECQASSQGYGFQQQ